MNRPRPAAPLPKLSEFERRLAQVFVRDRVFEKRLAVAFSGGKDSTALLTAVARLKDQFRCELVAIHIQHQADSRSSTSSKPKVSSARQEARKQAEELCKTLGVPVVVQKALAASESEEDLRRARYKALSELRSRYDLLLTAHHQDDLLETRLLRLLRGTGPLGFRAIRSRRGNLWRPLLEFDSKLMAPYLESRGLTWFDDPTNLDPRWMRNWVRQVWLKQLDHDHPTARAVLSRSLQSIAASLDSEKNAYIRRIRLSAPGAGPSVNSRTGLRPQSAPVWGLNLEVLSLPQPKILDQLALFCHTVGLSSYSQAHLHELLKRLRSHDGFQSCRILGVVWSIEAGHLCVKGAASQA